MLAQGEDNKVKSTKIWRQQAVRVQLPLPYAKSLLIRCGYGEDLLQQVQSLMLQEPDADDNASIESSPSAYILRRDWVGRSANICGMSAEDIDYLIGHYNPARNEKDYTNRDIQRTLARQLERYVFLPEYSRHPYFFPITAEPAKTVDLESYGAYRISAGAEPVEISLDLITNECGQCITLCTNGQVKKKATPAIGLLDTPDKRRGRPLIGSVHDRDYYSRLNEQSRSIDLSDFR